MAIGPDPYLVSLLKRAVYEPPKGLKGRGIREELTRAGRYQKGGKKRTLLATRMQMARQGASEARRRERAARVTREARRRVTALPAAPKRFPKLLTHGVPAMLTAALAVEALRRYRARKKQPMAKAAAGETQPPTGLSGLGTHISRAVKQRGGTYQMLMLGIRDAPTDQFAGQLMDLTRAGRYGMARQQVIMANFPDDMRDRILGTLDSLRAQPGIPEHYKSMSLLSAFDPK